MSRDFLHDLECAAAELGDAVGGLVKLATRNPSQKVLAAAWGAESRVVAIRALIDGKVRESLAKPAQSASEPTQQAATDTDNGDAGVRLEARLMQAHGLAYTLSDMSGDAMCPEAIRTAFYGLAELISQAQGALSEMQGRPD